MRELHIGRLVDHVHPRARDLAATKRFYRAVLGALGKPISADDEHHLWCDVEAVHHGPAQRSAESIVIHAPLP